MKLLTIAGALASLQLVAAACDDGAAEPPLDVVISAAECAEQGGRHVPNPGGGAPSCRDDEIQIAWVVATEYGRCCLKR